MWFLAALLFVQSVVGAAHCLRSIGGQNQLSFDICSADARHVILADVGDPSVPVASSSGFCAACHALPAIDIPPPPLNAERVVWARYAQDLPRDEAAPHPPARGPPLPPRAPPTLS